MNPVAAHDPVVAATRLRDTSRWLMVAFGGIAAAVFAGLTISQFGTLAPGEDTLRFSVASVGALAALGGALTSLYIAASLSAASTVSIADLRADSPEGTALHGAKSAISQDPGLSPWQGQLNSFLEALDDAYRQRERQYQAVLTSDSLNPTATS